MEKKRAVILFADIQGSTRYGYTQDVEPYNAMIRDYHRTVKRAIEEYCETYGLDRERLTCSVKGDECCMFITGGKPGENEEHALRVAVYLKEKWKQSNFVVRIQKAAETGLYPLVDLRIGIGSGEVACDRDCWTSTQTYEGIRISEAKRIEGMADEAKETLMMVKWEVKEACQKAGLDVRFGDGERLVGKGVPEGMDIAVYPVMRYGDWARVRQAVPKAQKPEWAGLFEEALAMHKSGEYELAIEAYKKALQLRSDIPEAWAYMGEAYLSEGDDDRAIESYQKVVQLRPTSAEAWNALANAYLNKGELSRAIETYQEALNLRADLPDAWVGLGMAYVWNGQYNQAVEAYRKALKLRPYYPLARYNLACAHSLLGQTRYALRHLRRAIELEPNRRDVARTDPDFEPIRDRLAFRRLVGQT